MLETAARFVIAFSHKIFSSCQMHSHKGVEIVFHPSGSGSTRCADGSEVDFKPGDTILYPQGMLHDQCMVSKGVDSCVQIEILKPECFPGFTKILKLTSIRSKTALAELSAPFAWEDDCPKEAKDLRASALLLTLLEEAEHQSQEPSSSGLSAAREARAIACAELRKPPSSLEIAKTIGISADHLRHLMLKHFGKGLKEIALEARMERAVSLLANSPMTLKEIAGECGFANPRALCDAFKKRLGNSPGFYRR